VEAVLVVPVAMLVLAFALQAALWAHAAQLVQVAAARGDDAARQLGGTVGAGVDAARAFVRTEASGLLSRWNVDGRVLPGDVVEIQVRGKVESLIPGVSLPVSAVRAGPMQEFRISG
jgi:hypothetical protein